ncbi:hypothetical protein G6F71_006037 [Rhizopus microsporus]|nr:hypothetical protein G6F71_006037 [Rhizopus microsporus]KAG1208136.1 hypothetical protein G6F69_007475 [Rhizopus microsporus]KAG1229204.1 hypothetical protein G6F67_007318 [Rhizopus microsporus]
MDYIIHEERYALETFSSHTQYLHNQPQENNFDVDSMAKDEVDVCISKRAYTLYTDQDKVRFFKLMFGKVLSASTAAKQLDLDSIFIKHKKTGRPRILHEEHKQVILEYIDENPSAVLEQAMERLLQKFRDLKVSKSTVYNFVRKWECTDMDFACRCTNPYCRRAVAALDRYRLWNRDVAACLNYMHILRGLRRNGMVPDRSRRVAVASTRRRRRVDDQEQPRTRVRLDDDSPS